MQYVIAGVVQHRDTPPQRLWLRIIERLCELAKITYRPGALQMGEFNARVGDRQLAVRLYLFATAEGPAAILRFSDTGASPPATRRRAVEKHPLPRWADEAHEWLAAARTTGGNDPQAGDVYRQLEADCALGPNQP